MERILIIRFSSLGDLILTTPALDNLKAALPQVELGLATKFAFADLFRHDPRLARLFLLEADKNLWQLGQEIRAWQPDLVIDLHANLRSRWLSLLLGRPVSRYDSDRAGRQALVRHKKTRPVKQHTIDLYLAGLHRLNIPVVTRQPRLFPPLANGPLSAQLQALGDRKIIGLNPGALHFTKRWPYFAELTTRLLADPHNAVILFGGSGDRETNDLAAGAGHPRLLDTTGQLSLSQLAAGIRQCKVFVTNDTGPMHMAVAVGTPVVAIFGGTTPELGFWPYGEHNRIVETALPCRPCHLHGQSACPLKHFRCMRDIAVDAVYDAVCAVVYK